MPDAILRRLQSDFGLTPVVSTEIEFYLHGAGAQFAPAAVLALLEDIAHRSRTPLARAEAERGPHQYEVSLVHTNDVAELTQATNRFKSALTSHFQASPVNVDFRAKPKKDAPGSGLHIHVHLESKDGKNQFYRTGDIYSDALLHAVGGLLALLNPCMPMFAPSPESYDRFNYTANDYLICPAAANLPLTVSWGANNRTVAVRLPNKPMDHKHLEHRVAGSDADVAATIHAVLSGIHYGLARRCDPGAPTYGDASLPQYGLPRIARSLDEALGYRAGCSDLRDYTPSDFA